MDTRLNILPHLLIEGLAFTEYKKHNYTPTTQTQQRINELGLGAINSDEPPFMVLKKLEDGLLGKANLIKSKKFGYKIEDFKKSIEFFEVLSLYASQSKSMHEGLDLYDPNDKTIFKAVKELETINRLIESNLKKKENKVVIRNHIDRAFKLINKIYTNNLDHIQQLALAKTFEKAKKILKDI